MSRRRRAGSATAGHRPATRRRRFAHDTLLVGSWVRMMGVHEVGSRCGFGEAVAPQVGEWIGARLRAALHDEPAA